MKNKVAQDFFGKFDCTEVIRDIDFVVKLQRYVPLDHPSSTTPLQGIYLLWAEAKKNRNDILTMLTQLTLTIGKARIFDRILPPPFLGCFDSEKIAFVPYADIQDIFYQNDFNWKVAPSDLTTREFKQVYAQIEKIIAGVLWQTFIFDFEKDEKELKLFIHQHFDNKGIHPLVAKIRIDKNNFITIYNKWLEAVKPSIAVNWEIAKKNHIIDCDFYLADLMSANQNEAYFTLKDKLSVLLKSTFYETICFTNEMGLFTASRADFYDYQQAHAQFWAKYERPPLEEYWGYITDRRDLLVPQDVRERKGSFYTPKIWVELSQKYLSDVLGTDWQDEYYVWDCAAGTGNLLAGLTNKYNVWASTLDKADVDVMKDRIHNGANLLESHVFQFDFLNDDFSKLPKRLQDIINDPLQRKKLVVYINPPYIEGDARIGKGRKGTQTTKIHEKYQKYLGKASGELFAHFFMRIYCEIPSCRLAHFSTLKHLQAPNFTIFRNSFLATLEELFLVPADTFDNVTGQFPIGFFIWDTSKKTQFKQTVADVYDEKGSFLYKKNIFSYDNSKFISDWLEENSKHISKNYIGHLASIGNDFQHQRDVYIDDLNRKKIAGGRHTMISIENLIVVSVYYTVRKIIPATWLNDRDQFLYPNNGWQNDDEFLNDCLAYTLFTNNISTQYGVNHWIPFMEQEVNARDNFDSHFMMSFIDGKIIQNRYSDLFKREEEYNSKKREFSETAQNVFNAGRQLWRYYHSVISSPAVKHREDFSEGSSPVNASLYDIRAFFQGHDYNGKMKNRSDDESYNELIGNLRSALQKLASKIESKVYEYGFLKK